MFVQRLLEQSSTTVFRVLLHSKYQKAVEKRLAAIIYLAPFYVEHPIVVIRHIVQTPNTRFYAIVEHDLDTPIVSDVYVLSIIVEEIRCARRQ